LLRITIDQDKCVGAGSCVLSAPDVFDQRDEDGIVVLRRDTAPEGQDADVLDAARACPALAIDVQE
jgi:ferredoxin